MFGPKMGYWAVHSDIDPRWNKEGEGKGNILNTSPRAIIGHSLVI